MVSDLLPVCPVPLLQTPVLSQGEEQDWDWGGGEYHLGDGRGEEEGKMTQQDLCFSLSLLLSESRV